MHGLYHAKCSTRLCIIQLLEECTPHRNSGLGVTPGLGSSSSPYRPRMTKRAAVPRILAIAALVPPQKEVAQRVAICCSNLAGNPKHRDSVSVHQAGNAHHDHYLLHYQATVRKWSLHRKQQKDTNPLKYPTHIDTNLFQGCMTALTLSMERARTRCPSSYLMKPNRSASMEHLGDYKTR